LVQISFVLNSLHILPIAAQVGEGLMLLTRCRTCSKQIDAKARICPRCGALTGVNTRTSDEPPSGVLGFSAAAAVVLFIFLFLKWLGLLP
jgi:hypothetical protein